MKQCAGQDASGETVIVKVGDFVEFKADIEQIGKVTRIEKRGSDYQLTLENPDGFPGDYLRYATVTTTPLSCVWAVKP